MTTPMAESVECPYCGEPPTFPCRTPQGLIKSYEHAARRALATVTLHRTLNCAHCGEPIDENGTSPTGYAHRATQRARCDGKRVDSRNYRAPMALPTASTTSPT